MIAAVLGEVFAHWGEFPRLVKGSLVNVMELSTIADPSL